MPVDIGMLQPYAVGIAVADIEVGEDGENSPILKVKLLNILPSLNGEVNDEVSEVEIPKIVVPDGEKSVTLKITDWAPMTWFNRNPNRRTVPDIMLGERVHVLKRLGTEEYYWEQIDIDTHLRTKERVVFYISNTNPEDRKTKELTPENCHMVEFDTKNKVFKLTTNKNDEEPFAFELTLDMLNGFLKYNDDDELHIIANSQESFIEMINKEKTQLRMDKKDILHKCDGNYTLEVGGDFITKIGKTRTVEVGGTTTYTYKGDVTMTAPNYSVETTFTFTGDITHTGSQTTSATVKAKALESETVNASKTVDAGKQVSAPKLSGLLV